MKVDQTQDTRFDYSKLRARTAELGKTDKSVAAAGGMTPSTYSLKLNGMGVFTQKQICGICEFLQINSRDIPLYFFAH